MLRVALPLIVSSGSASLMHVVDRMFLTWYSQDAMAASMPAGLLAWVVLSLPMGVAIYANTFVAQYEGAKRPDQVARSIWQGLYFAVVAGFALLPLALAAKPIFALIGHEAALQDLEVKYFAILCFQGLPLFVATVLSCFFSGRGESMVVMWVTLAASLANGLLDYVFIFGMGPIPAYGISGAAWATVVAQVVCAALYAALIWRRSADCQYRFSATRGLNVELFRRYLRYGFPNGVQMLVDVAGFTVFILLVGSLGSTSMAATSLAFNLNTLAFIPMMGLGTAVMVLVGQKIGAGRPELAAQSTWVAFGLASAYMLSFAAIYLGLPDLILRPYAVYADPVEFEQLRETVVLLLRFVALYSFFDGMVIVFGSALRGAGDTRFAVLVSLLGAFTFMIGPTYIAFRWFDGGLLASWSACSTYVAALGLIYLVRFHWGPWREIRVIEESPADHERDLALSAEFSTGTDIPENGAAGVTAAENCPAQLLANSPPGAKSRSSQGV